MINRIFLLLLALIPGAWAGYDFAISGEVHHVEATQNKIVLIVSGSCRFVDHECP